MSNRELQSPVRPRLGLLSRSPARQLQLLLDVAILVAAFFLAYLLRYDFSLPDAAFRNALVQLPLVLLLQLAVLFFTGIFTFVWRYIGMTEIRAFFSAAFFSSFPLLVLRLGLPAEYQPWRIPLSVILMDAVLAFGGLLTARVARRALYERLERNRRSNGPAGRRAKPVLLVGAGRAGIMTAREILGRGDMNIRPVGFVDDDPQKQGTVIHGIRVLGTSADLPRLVRELDIDHVIITIAEAGAQTIRGIVEICERARVRVQIIPGLYEILQGTLSFSRFRDIQIEDLLGRETVRLDEDEVRRFLGGKTVLVTGAGGSIGSELCRQIARFSPAHLLLIERSEGALFEIEQELRQLWPGLDSVALVADVGDEVRMRSILTDQRPHVVLHAAAHKHVPMMETNPGEAIKNNVLATRLLGRLAGELGVEAFVFVSTDKAVRPSSVMGASKRVAELVIQSLDRQFPRTRFVAVRFGNVLGSTGSVVPIFRQQIARGGPVTVTHPEATRYFMTIAEAAQLVLEAGAIGKAGEIMVLDMGQPLKILDLAKDMIALSGHKPFEEIPIEFVGLRPGEKLFEDLELSSEEIDRTRHPKIFVGHIASFPPEVIEELVGKLGRLAEDGRPEEIRQLLAASLPEAQLEGPVEVDGLDSSEPTELTH